MLWRGLANVRFGVYALIFALVGCWTNQASAQECPRFRPTGGTIVSQVRALEGRLIFHDGIRQWFELKLDRPQCGQKSVQLVQLDEKAEGLEVFRDCRVETSGDIDFSGTGYFSLETYQSVKTIRSIGTCSRRPPFADYSHTKPDPRIRAYKVDMHVNYRPGDHPIIFHVRSAGKELRPWQAYASYWLTGSFVLYGSCGDGFVVDKVFGPPEARPGHFAEPRTGEDRADFDPESAAGPGRWDLHLGYTCIR